MLALLQGALGQFHHQVLRLEAMLGQHAVDLLEQVFVLQLPGGQVDVQRELSRGNPAAALELATRLAEQPVPDRNDQAGLLRQGHEVLRRDHPALGVRPADERFQPLDAAALRAGKPVEHDASGVRHRPRFAGAEQKADQDQQRQAIER